MFVKTNKEPQQGSFVDHYPLRKGFCINPGQFMTGKTSSTSDFSQARRKAYGTTSGRIGFTEI